MSRSTKPRKRYVPRVPASSGLNVLIAASIAHEPLDDGDAGEFELIVLSALEAVTHGHGTRREWDSIANALNQAWTLAHNGIGAEMIPTLSAAQDGMRRAVPRFDRTGKVALDGDALRDVRHALTLWGQQLRMCTIGEVDAATRLVQREYWKRPETRA